MRQSGHPALLGDYFQGTLDCGIRRRRCGAHGVRVCEPQPCRRRDLRAVPVLLGMARRMAVGGVARLRRPLRDARDDVLQNGRARAGL